MDISERDEKESADIIDQGRFESKVITDGESWDAFVDASPYGTLFHRWAFIKIMEKHSGQRLFTYGIYAGGELVCILPLFMKSYYGLRMISSPPPKIKATYMGFVLCGRYGTMSQRGREVFLESVTQQIDGILTGLRPNYVYIQVVPGFEDIRPFKWDGYGTKIGYEYAVDLSPSMDELWEGLSKDCRDRIKACRKLPITIKKGRDLDLFYGLTKGDLKPQGKLTITDRTIAYLKDLMAEFTDSMWIDFMYCGDEAVGISINYVYKDKFVGWIGSYKKNFGEYLEWDLISRAKAQGYRFYENPDANAKRLTQFKSKFNPTLEIDYDLYRKDALVRALTWSYSWVFKKTV